MATKPPTSPSIHMTFSHILNAHFWIRWFPRFPDDQIRAFGAPARSATGEESREEDALLVRVGEVDRRVANQRLVERVEGEGKGWVNC